MTISIGWVWSGQNAPTNLVSARQDSVW